MYTVAVFLRGQGTWGREIDRLDEIGVLSTKWMRVMYDVGLAVLRGVTGGLLAGHGAQKLFGAFEGPGLTGTAGFMEALGLRPGRVWGTTAALSEFGGGTLTALGLLHPLGPIGTISAMSMATAKAHWGKPIWVTAGGAELPVTNIGVAVALILTGPGAYSLDNALGIALPKGLVAVAMLGAGVMIGYGIMQQPAPPEPAKEEARTTVQGGEAAADSTLP